MRVFITLAALGAALVSIGQAQQPLEILLADTQQLQQQPPLIVQLLSEARVNGGGRVRLQPQQREHQQLSPLSIIPVEKSPELLLEQQQEQDEVERPPVRKFRPRLLRQRLRQTLTNLKNRDPIVPLPITVAPPTQQPVTESTPRPSRTSLFNTPRRRFRPRPRTQSEIEDEERDNAAVQQTTAIPPLNRRFPGFIRRPIPNQISPVEEEVIPTTTTTTTTVTTTTTTTTQSTTFPSSVPTSGSFSGDFEEYDDNALALFQSSNLDLVPTVRRPVQGTLAPARRLPVQASPAPLRRRPVQATLVPSRQRIVQASPAAPVRQDLAEASPAPPNRQRFFQATAAPARQRIVQASPAPIRQGLVEASPAPNRQRIVQATSAPATFEEASPAPARRRRPVGFRRRLPAQGVAVAANGPIRIRNRQRGRLSTPVAVQATTTVPFQDTPFEPQDTKVDFEPEIFDDEYDQFEDEMEEIRDLHASTRRPVQPIQLPALQEEQVQEPVRQQPEPIRQQPEPIRQQPEPARQQPEPVRQQPEPVRQQRPPLQLPALRQTLEQAQQVQKPLNFNPIQEEVLKISKPQHQFEEEVTTEEITESLFDQQETPVRQEIRLQPLRIQSRQRGQALLQEVPRAQEQTLRQETPAQQQRPTLEIVRQQETPLRQQEQQPLRHRQRVSQRVQPFGQRDQVVRQRGQTVSQPAEPVRQQVQSVRQQVQSIRQQVQPVRQQVQSVRQQVEHVRQEVEPEVPRIRQDSPRRLRPLAVPRRNNNAARVRVLDRYSHRNADGSLTWGYENADGSFKEETIGTNCVTLGRYGYLDADGKDREFTYQTGVPCDPLTKEPLDQDQEVRFSSSPSGPRRSKVAKKLGYFDYNTNRFVTATGRRVKVVVNNKNRRRMVN